MKNKTNRLDAIKAIVSSNRIGGQEELLEQLRRKGFELTQATLSRDLKSLQIVKIAHQSGGYQYILPEAVGLASRKPTVRVRAAMSLSLYLNPKTALPR